MILPRANHFAESLERRAYGYCTRYGRYGYYPNCRSTWRTLGRWLLLGLLLFSAFALVFLFLFVRTIRRRRQRKATVSQPPAQYYSGQPQQQEQYQPPPGPPGQPNTNPNAGYYGAGEQQYGVTPPPNVQLK